MQNAQDSTGGYMNNYHLTFDTILISFDTVFLYNLDKTISQSAYKENSTTKHKTFKTVFDILTLTFYKL